MDILNGIGDIKYIPFPKHIVQTVDYLIAFRNKKIGQTEEFDIKSEAHWDVIVETFKVFMLFYPEQFKYFKKSIEHYRSTERKFGVNNDNGASIQHQLELPEEFHILLRVMYPKLKYDKPFVSKLSKKLPILKATKSNI